MLIIRHLQEHLLTCHFGFVSLVTEYEFTLMQVS